MPQSWDMGQMFYFPSEGRHAEEFFNRKNPTAWLGVNRRSWVPEASMLNNRPPKPLSIPDGVIGIFHWHILPSGVSNRNEYQEYFLWVKAAGSYGWQPCHLHVPILLKSWSPNLLETSGPVKACNGVALPFYEDWEFCHFIYSYVLWLDLWILGNSYVTGLVTTSTKYSKGVVNLWLSMFHSTVLYSTCTLSWNVSNSETSETDKCLKTEICRKIIKPKRGRRRKWWIILYYITTNFVVYTFHGYDFEMGKFT
jgi:hypothetical protein